MFENPVSKIKTMLDAMTALDVVPECECFDTGIVRSISMFQSTGMLKAPAHVSLVMGVASGMPANPAWLPLLVDELPDQAHFQVIAIGRQEVSLPLPLLTAPLPLVSVMRTLPRLHARRRCL